MNVSNERLCRDMLSVFNLHLDMIESILFDQEGEGGMVACGWIAWPALPVFIRFQSVGRWGGLGTLAVERGEMRVRWEMWTPSKFCITSLCTFPSNAGTPRSPPPPALLLNLPSPPSNRDRLDWYMWPHWGGWGEGERGLGTSTSCPPGDVILILQPGATIISLH